MARAHQREAQQCTSCGRVRGADDDAGSSLLAAVADGWWARSWRDPGACLCGRCYRALHPLEREGWRRPSALLGLAPGTQFTWVAESLLALG